MHCVQSEDTITIMAEMCTAYSHSHHNGGDVHCVEKTHHHNGGDVHCVQSEDTITIMAEMCTAYSQKTRSP